MIIKAKLYCETTSKSKNVNLETNDCSKVSKIEEKTPEIDPPPPPPLERY